MQPATTDEVLALLHVIDGGEIVDADTPEWDRIRELAAHAFVRGWLWRIAAVADADAAWCEAVPGEQIDTGGLVVSITASGARALDAWRHRAAGSLGMFED